MERLTTTSDKGGLAFKFDLDITCKESEIKKIVKLGERLKAYEDTRLTPEQIKEIDKLCSEQAKELAELKELRTPKKPTYEGDGYSDGQMVYDTWICPCCDTEYEVDYDEYDYCPNCGQKIDWSGENETN